MNPKRQAFSANGPARRRLRTRLWQLAAVLLLAVAAYVVLGRQLMALVPHWHEPLETRLEEQLGTALDIGALSGRMDGLSPVLELQDLRLPVPDGDAPLELDQVVLTLDVLSSLVERRPRLRRLLIRGASLDLARSDDGDISFRGLETEREPPSLRRALAWVYRQNRVVLDEVHLGLDWPGLPRLETRDLELALINSGRHHRLSLRADSVDGERSLDLRLGLDQDAFRWSELDGDVYARMQGDGWQRWLEHADLGPITAEGVDGDLSVWADLDGGQPGTATVKAALDELKLRDQRNDGRWRLSSASALGRLEQRDSGYHLSLRQMQLSSKQGEWQAGELGLFWNPRPEKGPKWRVLARNLDLAATREQLLELPFVRPEALEEGAETLRHLAPRGQVEEFQASGRGSAVDFFSGRVRHFACRARDGLPGLEGVSGWFAGTPERGVARLDSDALALDLAGLYEQTLKARARGALQWTRRERGLVIESGRIRLRNEHARADALMSLHLHDEQTPELRLVGDLREGQARAAARYVPDGKVNEELGRWLDNAFEGGRVTRGRFLYQGPVQIDPRRQQDRTLQMGFRFEDLRLHFLDGWPAIRDLEGRVELDGRRVEGTELSGRLRDTRLEKVAFAVPGVPPGTTPELTVSGDLRGPPDDLSHIFHNTPLRERLPPAVRDWGLTGGELDAELMLHWPLGPEGGEPRLLSQGRLRDANLDSERFDVRATGLGGDFSYELRRGLNMERITGELLGRPLEGRVRSDGEDTRINLTGSASMTDLRARIQNPWLELAEGSLDYQAELTLPRDGDRIALSLTSPLRDLTLKAPAPLGKQASRAVPLSVDWNRGDPADEVRFRYGDQLDGLFFLEQDALARGHLALGGAPATVRDEPGVRVDGELDYLDARAWVDWIRERRRREMQSPPPLDELALTVDTLDLYGVEASNSRLNLAPHEQGWRVELDSDEVTGSLRVPSEYRVDGDRPLELTLNRAHLQPGEGTGKPAPADMPIADVDLRDVRVNGTDYGRWAFALRPTDQGVVFQDLEGRWRKTDFHGRLNWTQTPAGQQSHFVGRVTAGRLHNALNAWDLDAVIESKDARSVVDIRWPGSPLDADYQALQGHASVDIGECRIPETSRGASALRVLGILNVGSLSRRLRLDFSDLYKKGLSCDAISGDFQLQGPRITTDNLVIESPSAEFRIQGELNLDTETLDHRMDVTLPLSSNLYAGCLAGPAACAGIFVFDRLWGSNLEKMTTLSYRVTGPWQEPEVRELGESD